MTHPHNRIAELAQQALRETTIDGFADEVYRADGYAASVSKAFVDRFSELLIKGCISQAMNEIIENKDIDDEWSPLMKEYLKGINRGAVDSACAIKLYFGIE